jgi:hypothetical protein
MAKPKKILKKRFCLWMSEEMIQEIDGHCKKVSLSRGQLFHLLACKHLKINDLRLDIFGVKK